MSTPKRLLHFSTLVRVRRVSRGVLFHLYPVFFRHVFQTEPTLDLYETNKTTSRLIRVIRVRVHIYTLYITGHDLYNYNITEVLLHVVGTQV